MSYADKKAKREQEIAGLKEALTILSADAFLQVSLQYMFDTLRKEGKSTTKTQDATAKHKYRQHYLHAIRSSKITF